VQKQVSKLFQAVKPCGARVLKKTGERTEYMRTFLLPEVKSMGRPATLITPNVSFRTGYNVMLRQGQEEHKAQLTTEILTTQSFSQFTFTWLQAPVPKVPNKYMLQRGRGEKLKPKMILIPYGAICS
jgi:hypothetical protein